MRNVLREPRIVLGIALMCAATIAAGMFLQHASRREQVWRMSRAMAAGMELTAADVHLAEVALAGASATYVAGEVPVVGQRIARDLAAGELLPTAALGDAPAPDAVAIAPDRTRMPSDLHAGQRVDVWWTTGGERDVPARTVRVLGRVPVLSVAQEDLRGRSVVLGVPHAQVQALVFAMRSGAIDIVGVR